MGFVVFWVGELKTIGDLITKENEMRRTVSKTTQLKNSKIELEKAKKELETAKADLRLHQEFFIKEYKLHLSCIEKKETIALEPAIKRYSVHLNKVQPFYTGLI